MRKTASPAPIAKRGRPVIAQKTGNIKGTPIEGGEYVSTTEFRAGINDYIRKCKKSRRPIVLSSHGYGEVALIPLEDLEALKGIQQGRKEIAEGKGIPNEKVFAELLEKFG